MLLLSLLIACGAPATPEPAGSPGSVETVAADEAPVAAEDPPVAPPSTEALPPVADVVVDYDGDLLTTRYVSDAFEVETMGSGEGAAVRFLAKIDGRPSDAVYVHVAFPAGGLTPREAEALLLDKGGVMKSRGWSPGTANHRPEEPWATREVIYLSEDGGGRLMVGVDDGVGFYAFSHVTDAHRAVWEPRLDTILGSLALTDAGREQLRWTPAEEE